MRWSSLALGALLGAGAAACGGGDPSATEQRADQVRQAALDAGLPEEVADLLADAAAGLDATYAVTYELDDQTVVVTQRPPDRRIDVTDADGTRDTTVTADGTTHACTDPPGDDPVRCDELGRTAPTGIFDDDAVAELVASLTESADRFTLRVETREVAGASARCLVAEGGSADGSLCLSPSGAVLLVERPSGTLRAVRYSADVDDDAFDLPA